METLESNLEEPLLEGGVWKLTQKSIKIVDLLVLTKLAKSRSEAKRLITQGAITLWEFE